MSKDCSYNFYYIIIHILVKHKTKSYKNQAIRYIIKLLLLPVNISLDLKVSMSGDSTTYMSMGKLFHLFNLLFFKLEIWYSYIYQKVNRLIALIKRIP